jgi:hypothetical protein
MNMIWIYRALAITALVARIFIIVENYEKMKERRKLKESRRIQKRDSEKKEGDNAT